MQWNGADGNSWMPWFAWRPVRDINRTWCWLEWVDRIHFRSSKITLEEYCNTSGVNFAYRARQKQETV